MSGIANYGELRQALSDYVNHRNLSQALPRIVKMAEDRLNQKLRTRYQITSGTLTFADGVTTLPADFLEMIDLFGVNGTTYRSGPTSDAQRFGSMWSRYSIAGGNITIKGYSGDRTINYYARIPTITGSSADTNWLLDGFPDVYLYAVGVEAAKFLRDLDLVQISKSLLDDALMGLRVDDERARWSNTTVRVQGLTP
jgi:hypothetical protein